MRDSSSICKNNAIARFAGSILIPSKKYRLYLSCENGLFLQLNVQPLKTFMKALTR